jgi:Zn-dependent protease
MFRSIRVARVLGVDVRIHITFVMFLAWIALAHLTRGGIMAAVQGLIFTLALFTCVLLHEFGHILAAKHFGILTSDVTLFPIGGVARLQRIPEKPSQELVVALAGPMVNVIIAAFLILLVGSHAQFEDLAEIDLPSGALFAKLVSVNISLVLFNLIPAFPMDGGRVLRSVMAITMNYTRATLIAVRVGQFLAIGFGIIGLFGSPMLIFIAFFIYAGAQQEAAFVQMAEARRRGYPVPSANAPHPRNV